MILKKCDVDIKKRAGELTPEEINKIVAVVANPTQFRIPSWYAGMLNLTLEPSRSLLRSLASHGLTPQKYSLGNRG